MLRLSLSNFRLLFSFFCLPKNRVERADTRKKRFVCNTNTIGACKKSEKIDQFYSVSGPVIRLIFSEQAYLQDFFIGNKVAE